MTGAINANETLNGGVEAIPTLSGTLSGNTTSSYNSLSDKPIINGTTLEGGVDRSLVEDVKVNGVSVVNEEHIAEIECGAEDIPYDNSDSHAQSTDVQGALDEAFERTVDLANGLTSAFNDVAENYTSAQHNYIKGDYVLYETKLYRCISDTSGAWDSTKWEEVKLSNEVEKETTLREELEEATKVYGTPKNLPQPIATFTDGANLPMPSLKTTIVPIQEGSGDPSPSNVRPISGWTEENVTVSPTTDAEDGHTYTIDLDGTRYGGELDVVSGVLTVDKGYVDLGSLNYTYYSGNLFTVRISDLKPVPNEVLCDALCSIYVAKKGNEYSSIDGSFVAGFNNSPLLAIHDSRFTDATAFKTAMAGQKLVYELATPTTFNSQPTSINSIEGENNVWADCGNIKDLKYTRNLNITINDLISRVEALEG